MPFKDKEKEKEYRRLYAREYRKRKAEERKAKKEQNAINSIDILETPIPEDGPMISEDNEIIKKVKEIQKRTKTTDIDPKHYVHPLETTIRQMKEVLERIELSLKLTEPILQSEPLTPENNPDPIPKETLFKPIQESETDDEKGLIYQSNPPEDTPTIQREEDVIETQNSTQNIEVESEHDQATYLAQQMTNSWKQFVPSSYWKSDEPEEDNKRLKITEVEPQDDTQLMGYILKLDQSIPGEINGINGPFARLPESIIPTTPPKSKTPVNLVPYSNTPIQRQRVTPNRTPLGAPIPMNHEVTEEEHQTSVESKKKKRNVKPKEVERLEEYTNKLEARNRKKADAIQSPHIFPRAISKHKKKKVTSLSDETLQKNDDERNSLNEE
jgi:hypothetical protein